MRRKGKLGVALAASLIGFLGLLAERVRAGQAPHASLPAGPSALRDLLFYGLALLTLAGAAAVALSRNIVHSALGLLLALLGTASIYALLSADFLAIAQVLVYVGGVLVLILFAVMLTSRIAETKVSNASLGVPAGMALVLATAPVLLFAAFATPWATRPPPAPGPTTRAIGNAFLTRWLLPFEVASLVLLATLVGAVVVARKEVKRDEPSDPRS